MGNGSSQQDAPAARPEMTMSARSSIADLSGIEASLRSLFETKDDTGKTIEGAEHEHQAMKPRWPQADQDDSDPKPGKYVILYDNLPVTKDIDRKSAPEAFLAIGTEVEVEFIDPKPVDDRLRARLKLPKGWISLRTSQKDQPCQTIFAQLCELDPLHAEEPDEADDSDNGDGIGVPISSTPIGSGPIPDPHFTPDDAIHLRMPSSGPGRDDFDRHISWEGSELQADDRASSVPSQDIQQTYSGELDELGKRHGDGVQIFSDGRRYSGQFVRDTFSGAAIMVWPDGHRYTGQYENNHKHGEGFFLWPDGRFYDGQWRNGQRHGHGQYISDESYVGEYYEGFRHGDGVLTWPDGKRYAGEFCRGALHGSAVMTWPDGRQYFGQYVDNLKQGEGVFYWSDGRLYEGQWHRGLRHGQSRYIDTNAVEHIGAWRKDRLVNQVIAPDEGIRDPFCEAPVNLLSLRPKFTSTQLATRPWERVFAGGQSYSTQPDRTAATTVLTNSSFIDLPRTLSAARGNVPDSTGRGLISRSAVEPSNGIPTTNRSGGTSMDMQRNRQSDSTDVIGSSDVNIDVVEDKEADAISDASAPRGQPYVDYVPDDVHVVKIDGVAHPVYKLQHLRRMPPDALRGHAEAMHQTFNEAIGSEVPLQEQALLGWVYEVQARHLQPILDAALEDLKATEADEVLVVSADTAQDVEQHRREDEGEARDRDSIASTRILIDNDFEEPYPETGLEDKHEDSNFAPARPTTEPPPVQIPRKRQRQLKPETLAETK